MPVQNALTFIQQFRDKKIPVEGNKELPGFDELIQLANSHGYSFSKEELEKAFVIDWQMRWKNYSVK